MKVVRKQPQERTSTSLLLLGQKNNNNNVKCVPRCHTFTTSKTSSFLFRRGAKPVLVQCGSFLPGILSAPKQPPSSSGGLHQPFQRPSTKRRAYDKNAEQALKNASLGTKKRMNGMHNILARARKGLHYKLPGGAANKDGSDTEGETTDEEEDDGRPKPPEGPYDPIQVWTSPHQGGMAIGLPSRPTKVTRTDENGIEEEVVIQQPAPLQDYAQTSVIVPEPIGKWLRPHQRDGVQFMYECVMGLKRFDGAGCILADDMGLGKTLQSVALIYTLLKTGITAKGGPTAKRVIVVCPCSLVKNWENEFVKWLGPGAVKVMAIAEADRKKVEKDLDCFVRTKMFNVLVASYECIRAHVGRLTKYADCCDLLICDEAHRLKNSENQTSRALNSLPVRRRVLLTGTPMQNDLQEFYAMVDFTNRSVLGKPEQFRRTYEGPILRGREPDATDKQKQRSAQCQEQMSSIVNDFILRRTNTLNAKHLPPKLVQVVCIRLTDIQKDMYQHLVDSKDTQHVLDGKQVNCLASIQLLMKLSNHPSLVVEDDKSYKSKAPANKRSAATKKIKYNDDDEKESTAAPGADGIAKFLPYNPGGGGRGGFAPVHPEWSGKMFVLYRLMKEMRLPGNHNDKIVIISNYTQTLDLIGRMCKENSWRFCRLDGSVTMKKRQQMVEEFNDESSTLIAFLLSSKAGGCGLNLIGANRLVLFDPDWNPAVDKQAAARCWRDGQKKKCFTYRFLATGTVEEKIFQRQLAKEGLQSVVDDKEQVNALSTKDLRNLFKLRHGTPSDTHDKLECPRCTLMKDTAEMEEAKVLPKKLAACRELLDEMVAREGAAPFLKPMDPTFFGRTKEEYENIVKQPMDFGTIRKKLDSEAGTSSAYSSISGFSKDVNRIFSNVVKLWNDEEEITVASKELQTWWIEQWTALVPTLMRIKADGEEDDEEDEPVEDPVEEEILKHCAANPHNTRSDDYLPQIGMPEEENMRHWSHHHSTDSCDDPVFRNAMRGTDAVSFVFGLEVTWDLIQQREESEEAALVQAMQKDGAQLDEASSSSDDDDDDDSESDTSPEKGGDDDAASSDDAAPTAKRPEKKKAAKQAKADATDRGTEEGADSSAEEDDDDGEDLKDFIEQDGEGEDSDGDASMADSDKEEPMSDSEDDDDDEPGAESEGDDEKEATADKEGEDLVDSDNEEEQENLQCEDPVDSENEEEQENSQSQEDEEDSVINDASPTPNSKEKDAPESSAIAAEPSTGKTDKSTPCAEAEIADDSSPDGSAPEAEIAEDASPDGSASQNAQVLDSSPDVVAEIATSQESEASPLPPPARKENDKPNTNQWECEGCTFFNPNRKRKCEICQTKKPSAAAASRATGGRKKRSIDEL